jgi:heme A synthase
MISVLLTIIILVIVGGLLFWAIGMLPLPAPMMQIAKVCLILIFVLVLLGMLFGGVNMPQLRM